MHCRKRTIRQADSPWGGWRTLSGFTLIEFSMVLVLLGILSAQALPRFFNLTAYQQRVLYDDTLAALRYAQKLAIATHCNVQFSIAGNQFRLMLPASRASCNSQVAGNFTTTVLRPGSATAYTGSESGVSITTATIYFDSLGQAFASTTTIAVGTLSITLVPSTGFVS